MDKIQKVLNKLSLREKEAIKSVLQKIQNHNFGGLDVKKLRGRDNIFRVRKGNLRIIYRVGEQNNIFLLSIERRSDNTYEF